MENIIIPIYKKISLAKLEKILTTYTKNNRNTQYISFIINYINNYLKNIKSIKSINDFIEENKKQLEYYKKIDKNTKIYYHFLIDNLTKNIIGVIKVIEISELLLKSKYFIPLQDLYIDYKLNPIKIGYAINLYIDPLYRNKSMCKKLLLNVSHILKLKKFNYILSEIHKDNIGSIKCFSSLKFKKTNVLSYKDTYFYILKIK
jgi:ribosomal protein S18 acetylase RimI-like enzyme